MVKKSKLKRAALIFLTLLLMSGLILTASGSSQIYLMSVNDTVMATTVDNMPLISGGQLYVPYTMISGEATGIGLGVRVQYNASRSILTITDGQQTVTFDLRSNTAYDQSGKSVTARALLRDSMPYLPIGWVCSTFDHLKYSLLYTRYGFLVRVTNDAAVLSDSEFIDAAGSLLQQSLQKYQDSLVTPSPSVSSSPGPSTPPPAQTTEPGHEEISLVYLAFQWGSEISEVADLLEANGQRGLFLLEYTQLIQQDDLVRRLIGRGHQVGLALTGSDIVSCLSQLEYGRRLMTDIARNPLLIVSAAELNRSGRLELKEAGCAVWAATLQADGLNESTLLRSLEPEQPNYVELTCDRAGLELLELLLPALTGPGYQLRQALAPLL